MNHTLRYNEPGNHVSFLIKMHLSPVSKHYHDGCLYIGFISAFNYDFFFLNILKTFVVKHVYTHY